MSTEDQEGSETQIEDEREDAAVGDDQSPDHASDEEEDPDEDQPQGRYIVVHGPDGGPYRASRVRSTSKGTAFESFLTTPPSKAWTVMDDSGIDALTYQGESLTVED